METLTQAKITPKERNNYRNSLKSAISDGGMTIQAVADECGRTRVQVNLFINGSWEPKDTAFMNMYDDIKGAIERLAKAAVKKLKK